jgi:hypothetical protein
MYPESFAYNHHIVRSALIAAITLYTSKLLRDFIGRSEARVFTDGADDRPEPEGVHVRYWGAAPSPP